MNTNELDEYIEHLTDTGIIPCISLAIGHRGRIVHSRAFGQIPACGHPEGRPVTADTRFDVASITKILSGMCFLQLMERGLVSLDDPIYRIFPAFDAEKTVEKGGKCIGTFDGRRITWYHALTHTSGMGWTQPITNPSLPHLADGLEDIYALPFAAMPGEKVIYSDILIILMGCAVEILTGRKLDDILQERLCLPLGMTKTGYRRISRLTAGKPVQDTAGSPVPDIAGSLTMETLHRLSQESSDIPPTEYDSWFRHRRIRGEVHDENAWLRDGVAGHAGVFSTAEDLCTFALAYADLVRRQEAASDSVHRLGTYANLTRRTDIPISSSSADSFLLPSTAAYAIRPHAEYDRERRGILWQLSGRGEKAYTRYLSPRAYGHAGFTGCFLWNDPDRDLSVVLLSNDVFSGRENRRLFDHRGEIMRMIASQFPIA